MRQPTRIRRRLAALPVGLLLLAAATATAAAPPGQAGALPMVVDVPSRPAFTRRLGGDAVLRLTPEALDLEQGQIIAWIQPGRPRGRPLRLRTRVATAAITGTTVFVEASATAVKLFGWEGLVQVSTDDGRQVELRAGEQLSWENGAWQAKRRLTASELQQRRSRSILLNGFTAPMETLPVLERELGLRP